MALCTKIINTGHKDELDKNIKIENKSTRAEERPIMPVLFFFEFNILANKMSWLLKSEEGDTHVSRLLEQIHCPGSEALFLFIYEFGHSTQHINTHTYTYTYTYTINNLRSSESWNTYQYKYK